MHSRTAGSVARDGVCIYIIYHGACVQIKPRSSRDAAAVQKSTRGKKHCVTNSKYQLLSINQHYSSAKHINTAEERHIVSDRSAHSQIYEGFPAFCFMLVGCLAYKVWIIHHTNCCLELCCMTDRRHITESRIHTCTDALLNYKTHRRIKARLFITVACKRVEERARDRHKSLR